MFTEEEKTIFILGAGASWHYGYPTGEDLVKNILDVAKDFLRISKIPGKDTYAAYETYEIQRISQLKYISEKVTEDQNPEILSRKMVEDCKKLIQRLQQVNPPVIDYFLGQNESLADIGRFMISWSILKDEKMYFSNRGSGRTYNQNRLKQVRSTPDLEESRRKLDPTKYHDDWYRYIIYRLAANCKNSRDLLKNEVHFITFNYDTSLENLLSEGLRNIEFFKEEDVDEFLSKDIFHHVYGKIRKDTYSQNLLPDIKPERYSSNHFSRCIEKFDAVYAASKGIFTIDPHDKLRNSECITNAIKAIESAKNVYILGYGFDKNNNDRLHLGQCLSHHKEPSKMVHFTNFGDKQVINKRASKVFFGNPGRFHPNDPFVIPSGISIYEKSIRNVYESIEQDFDFL